MYNKHLKKAALAVALGACLGSVAPTAFAQSATGAVAGRAVAGEQIILTNPSTGLTRTVTAGADGSYRLAQLPVGEYILKQGKQELTVSVPLGGTATVNLMASDEAKTLDGVLVNRPRVVNRVDVYSTESSFNINREELSRMPVDQSLSAVAVLAPGVVASGASLVPGLSFGGSSVAENVAYINGLNVTDPFKRQGFSSVPFAFYSEVQVKTGGYSAEFGRSTGGVINAVTRSGSNEFHGGVQVTMEPAAWESSRKDRYYSDGSLTGINRTSRDASPFYKQNIWASGPVVKDKVFLFAMYEQRDADSRDIDQSEAWKTDSKNDFWGAKLDWRISDDHLVEVLAFSDKADSYTTKYSDYEWDSYEWGEPDMGSSSSGSGGENWSLTYTGHLSESFTAKLMFGENERSSNSGSSMDDSCSSYSHATYTNGPKPDRIGCHTSNGRVNQRLDKREAARVDFEWSLGEHLIRFGYDREETSSDSSSFNPGDGFAYSIQNTVPGAVLPNQELVPDGVTGLVSARRYVSGSPVSSNVQAFYIEDNWNITQNLLLNIGLRADKFSNTMASGALFAKADFSDMIAPRLGFSWDMNGDGTTKLFGNAGRYYTPLTNVLTDYFGGGTTDEYTYYALGGWQQLTDSNGKNYSVPVLGDQIGPINSSGNAEAPSDVRTIVAKDLKQIFQDEFILGFQQMINESWSYGGNVTYRRMTRTVEDAGIRHIDGCPGYSGWPIINPGETNTLWCSATNDWVSLDSSKDGYITQGSGIVMGFKKPKRTYKGIELQLDRAWDDKWAFNASYLWSKSEGNIEGPVNSDANFGSTNLVQYYDHPAVNERYGYLFNDHRHQIKLRGSYKLNDALSFGATFSAVSGGPITAYGVRWPDDNRSAGGPSEGTGGGSGWLCLANCSSIDRELVYTPRGAFGRMPWVKNLGLNVTWTIPVPVGDLKARFNVYNVLNSQAAVYVHSRYESTPGVKMPYFGEARAWQSPRYAQLDVSWSF